MAKEKEKRIPFRKLKGASKDVIFDLPAPINEGIGKVVMMHAILETQVSELLYDLAQISYPAGRVSFGYRNAGDRFSTIIALLDLHEIEPLMNVKTLRDQIKDCCVARDTLAHNVWIRTKAGEIAVRVAKGTFETPDGGKFNLLYMPSGFVPPPGYFDGTVETIRSTIAVVRKLKTQVKTEFEKRKEQEKASD